jgi:O-methyltransferase
MTGIGRKRNDFIYETSDYVRISSLELIAYEIAEKGIQGNVAELGVYHGDFAKYINILFPNRNFYLFDTFEGFDERDIKKEEEEGFSSYRHDFSDGNINLVLKKMKNPENCIIKKGFFPETAKDVEDNFVFVSIDADLFEPIYEGLCFFYPRLQPGGYIFVHDYNTKGYSGAQSAVRQFSAEFGVPYFPQTDRAGTAIFMK